MLMSLYMQRQSLKTAYYMFLLFLNLSKNLFKIQPIHKSSSLIFDSVCPRENLENRDLRSSMCGFTVCFFCLSAESASSENGNNRKFNVFSICQSAVKCCVCFVRKFGSVLRGSPSALTRLCCAARESLGLAGLLFTRLSALHTPRGTRGQTCCSCCSETR